MANYEMMVILSPDIIDDEVPQAVEKVAGFISKAGGSAPEVDHWGRRKMAYPIKKFTEGNYVLTRFELDPASVKDMEDRFQFSGEIIRHLLVRLKD